jgi:hypothetical protein
VFAPHSRWRAAITPAGRGSGIQPADTRTPAERHRALSWAQRLKRVFKLDLQSCEGCGGQVRVIACIEAPLVIGKILAHLETRGLQRADAGLAGPAAQATASRREWLSGVGFVRLILGCAEYSWPAGGYDCRPE